MSKNIPIKTMDNNHKQQFDNEQLVSMIHRLMDERENLWRENEYLKAKLNESILMETINEIRKERDLLLRLLLNLSTNNNKNEHIPHQNHYPEEPINGYSNDLLPPPPYQTFHSTPNSKSSQQNSNVSPKKTPGHSRSNQPPMTTPRDLSIPVTELKPSRRPHRTTKGNTDQHQPTVVYRVEGTKEHLMNPDELSSVFAHVKHSHPNKKIVVYKTSTTPQTHDFNQLVDEMCVRHGVELKHSQNSPFQQYRSQSLQDLTSPDQPHSDFHFQTIEKQEQTRRHNIKK